MIITKIHENKITSTGKAQQIVSVDDNPQLLTYWGNDLEEGQEFNGEIVPPSDPKYKPSLRAIKKASGRANFASKSRDIEKVMDKKQEGIKASQEAKFDGIARAGALRLATDIVIAQIEHGIYNNEGMMSSLKPDEVRRLILDEAKYYEGLYKTPFL